MKKVCMIIGAIVLFLAIVGIAVFGITSLTSKKLKCKSQEGNITIMYNDKSIVGYTASGITYDLDGQKKVAERIGIEEYLEQFKEWFSTNTTGSCE